MPVQINARYQGIVERMLELASSKTPWHRRLWRGGTVQLALELLDDCVRPGTPKSAIDDQRDRLSQSLKTDHGVADRGGPLQPTLRRLDVGLTTGSHSWIVFREQVDRLNQDYLANWADAFDTPPANLPIDAEGAARRITAHLFDSGMDRSSVFSWLRDAHQQPTNITISELLRDMDGRLKAPERNFEFCVPLLVQIRPPESASWPNGWISPKETTRWKKQFARTATSVRHQGSLNLIVKARDVNAAAERARTELATLISKFELMRAVRFVPAPTMWSRHTGGDFPTVATNRLITAKAFERLGRVYDMSMPDFITSAVALMQPLRTGAPHIAVLSGWSAIESLLVGADDSRDIVAAERFSLIVAASLVRAEFNWLANSYVEANATPEADLIRAATDSLTRGQLFQQYVAANSTVILAEEADLLALHRVRPILSNPRAEIERIAGILTHEFIRLYRKRNMIAHNGRIHDTSLQSIAHNMAPLIGAGVDQIIYAGLKTSTPPIELSAIAQARLALLTPATLSSAGNALELLEI